MRKQVAIITGASGGIGREFTRLVLRENIDEIWAIARNREKLDALKKDFGDKIIAISKDLGDADAMRSLADMLRTENPVVAYLINNAGIARMGLSQDFPAEEISATLSVHCYAMAALCSTCIPYMEKGSRILNISSVASPVLIRMWDLKSVWLRPKLLRLR